MGYDVNKVINIAAAEVGYLEKSKAAYKANPAILDQKTAGAGQDNYTKYGRDMHALYPSVMDFPAAWCDCFVDWCFQKAYGVSTAKSLLCGNFDDYTVNSCLMYQNKKALHTTPQVGDQVFFTKNGKYTGCYHTGLVIAVNGNQFTTIEGNTSAGSAVIANGGGVAKKTYTLKSGSHLFGRPAYGNSYASTTQPQFEKGYGNGKQFKVTASALNMRKDSNTSATIIAVLPRNTVVIWYGYYKMNDDDKWLYVQNPKTKQVGYCSKKYLA